MAKCVAPTSRRWTALAVILFATVSLSWTRVLLFREFESTAVVLIPASGNADALVTNALDVRTNERFLATQVSAFKSDTVLNAACRTLALETKLGENTWRGVASSLVVERKPFDNTVALRLVSHASARVKPALEHVVQAYDRWYREAAAWDAQRFLTVLGEERRNAEAAAQTIRRRLREFDAEHMFVAAEQRQSRLIERSISLREHRDESSMKVTKTLEEARSFRAELEGTSGTESEAAAWIALEEVSDELVQVYAARIDAKGKGQESVTEAVEKRLDRTLARVAARTDQLLAGWKRLPAEKRDVLARQCLDLCKRFALVRARLKIHQQRLAEVRDGLAELTGLHALRADIAKEVHAADATVEQVVSRQRQVRWFVARRAASGVVVLTPPREPVPAKTFVGELRNGLVVGALLWILLLYVSQAWSLHRGETQRGAS